MAVKSRPTQQFVPIKEIRDGVVVLKDGSMRMIIITSTVNFALKSEEEQLAILMQFQNFLNSLDFSTQIFIRSRRLDIRPYIATLQERLKHEINDLLKIQIQEYAEFIRTFTENVNIMSKTFFVVVSYSPKNIFSKKKKVGGKELLLNKLKGVSTETPKSDSTKKSNGINVDAFEEARSQLEQRVNLVKQGLSRTGIRAVPLDTDEIIELYYKFFNPGDNEAPVGKTD